MPTLPLASSQAPSKLYLLLMPNLSLVLPQTGKLCLPHLMCRSKTSCRNAPTFLNPPRFTMATKKSPLPTGQFIWLYLCRPAASTPSISTTRLTPSRTADYGWQCLPQVRSYAMNLVSTRATSTRLPERYTLLPASIFRYPPQRRSTSLKVTCSTMSMTSVGVLLRTSGLMWEATIRMLEQFLVVPM